MGKFTDNFRPFSNILGRELTPRLPWQRNCLNICFWVTSKICNLCLKIVHLLSDSIPVLHQDDYKALCDKYASVREDFEKKMLSSCKHFQQAETLYLTQVQKFLSFIRVLPCDLCAGGQICHPPSPRWWTSFTASTTWWTAGTKRWGRSTWSWRRASSPFPLKRCSSSLFFRNTLAW